VRRQAGTEGHAYAEGVRDRTGRSAFVVVANRLPVDEEITPERHVRHASHEGRVTAMRPVTAAREGSWVVWGGAARPAAEPFDLDGVRTHDVGRRVRSFPSDVGALEAHG
jgi:trehalose-6-phosphate synthase